MREGIRGNVLMQPNGSLTEEGKEHPMATKKPAAKSAKKAPAKTAKKPATAAKKKK
jgi:hypothetical protein